MKKTLVIIMAVAILGLLGFLVNKNKSDQASVINASNSSSQNTASAQTTPDQQTSGYRDGSYTKSADTPYGPVKITVLISGGKITDVMFDNMPNGDDRSAEITAFSASQLKDNAIKAQSAKIDFVSGATSTSYGFQESLQAALDAAS